MLKVGDYEVNEEKFAPQVTQRLLQRQVTHILSNECASNVLAKTKRAIVGKDGDPKTVSDEQLETFRASPDGAKMVEGWEDDFRSAKIQAMYDGTLSVRVARGPVRDPVETASRAIAKVEVTAVLKNNGKRFPKPDETLSIEKDGETQEFSGDDLIDRRLAHPEHGPRITKLAEKKVAEDKRLRENAVKATTQAGLGDL